MEIIFIGDEFYRDSKSVMSSMYTVEGKRYDFGFLRNDIEAGKTIHIRPATNEELGFYYKKLRTLTDI